MANNLLLLQGFRGLGVLLLLQGFRELVVLLLLQGFKREWAPFVLTPDFVYTMGGEVIAAVFIFW